MKKFSSTYIDVENLDLFGRYEHSLLFNCNIRTLENVQLLNCDLNHSKLDIHEIEKLKNYSCTMNCGLFENVEYSELCFDLILMLLLKTKGNDQKRKAIFRILGADRVRDLSKEMEKIEL